MKHVDAMLTITFNAFSFLQKKLKEKNLPYANVKMNIDPGTTALDLIRRMGLSDDEVEVVFINGKVGPRRTVIADGDRVAFVPPGTPGPYRVLLGFKSKANAS